MKFVQNNIGGNVRNFIYLFIITIIIIIFFPMKRYLQLPCLKVWLNFSDLALKLLEDHSGLAVARDGNYETALHVLARKPSAFASRNQGLLTRLMHSG